MKDILLIGAGQIGRLAALLLSRAPAQGGGGAYRVTVADASADALQALGAPTERLHPLRLDLHDAAALHAALAGRFAVLNAAPYSAAWPVAQAACAAGVHCLDLTEDVASTRRIQALAADARSVLLPQCGLAPGFVSIAAAQLARGFDRLDSVRLRVGALPAYPSNALNYNLTWSTEGVINEYCEPCEAIVDGQRHQVPALEEREELSIDGVRYEAFNTSGGLGTLCDTLAGRVRELNYRTIRYPGHAAIMKALLHDLRLKHRRALLKDILEQALPSTSQDVVIVFITVSGWRDGRLVQDSLVRQIHGRPLAGAMRSAIQLTTASSLCAMLDLLAEGRLPSRGFVRQEDMALPDFLANRFGQVFAEAQPLARAA